MYASSIRAFVALVAAVVGTALVPALAAADTVAPAAADIAVAAAPVPAGPYTIETRALTGPLGSDLTLWVTAVPPAAEVTALLKVQVKTYKQDGKLAGVDNVTNVPVTGGVANIDLKGLARGLRVETQVQIAQEAPLDTIVLRDETVVKLRPDLVVAVDAPVTTLSIAPVDIVAQVTEKNGEVGAAATVELWLGTTRLAEPKPVTVAAGDLASVRFEDVALTAPVLTDLTMVVKGADPGETDVLNNSRQFQVSVMEHAVDTGQLLVASLGGFGVQMNQHLYAAITPAPAGSLPEVEDKLVGLEPQLVRVFFNESQDTPAPLSFYKTLQLAQEAGAIINVTYQTAAGARLNPDPFMTRFAAVLDTAVRQYGVTNLRWVTIQNEANASGNQITLDQYQTLYRVLRTKLTALGEQDQIRFMIGDLVESSGDRGQRAWFQYIAANMADLADAYSVHIYWIYNEQQSSVPLMSRMEYRLRDVHRIVSEEIPESARRPVYITEYGIRGDNYQGPDRPGTFQGAPINRTNIAGLQQFWFNVAATQLGFAGTVKWDAYWAMYDNTPQAPWLIGPASEGWPLFPSYHALRLLFQTTDIGWKAYGVDPWGDDDVVRNVPDAPEKELAAYASDSAWTVVGLDSHARPLNTVSPDMVSYAIGGLPASTAFHLAIWNDTGDGTNVIEPTVTTTVGGVAYFQVPLHAAFALTTLDVS